MQLSESHRQPSASAELVCRQSRLTAAIAFGAYDLLLIVAPTYAWLTGQIPGVFLGIVLALAVLIVPLVSTTMLSTFRPTNWCVALEPDGLLINLRSYRNYPLPPAQTVLHLNYSDIALATRQIVQMSAPHAEGNARWREQFLELTVAHADLRPLRHAIAVERQCRAVRSYFGGAIVSSGRQNHVPVTVQDERRVRIAWRTRYDFVRPSIDQVLRRLSRRVSVDEAAGCERIDDWNRLTDSQIDDLILRFVEADDKLSAVSLLMKRRGYTCPEAKEFVDGLGNRLMVNS